jgi:hypothetical protein
LAQTGIITTVAGNGTQISTYGASFSHYWDSQPL